MPQFKQQKHFCFKRCVWQLLLFLISLNLIGQSFAQNPNEKGKASSSGNFNYIPYGNKPVELQTDGTSKPSRAEEIVKHNLERAYKALDPYAEKYGQKITEDAANEKERELTFGKLGPELNPLDKQGGHLNEAKSWNEYVTDSEIILNAETFPTCFEPRYIAEKKDRQLKPYDPLNALYAAACELNCPYIPPTLFTPPLNRNWQVVSYYWPEYQISVNKAGSQMIDPDIVGEGRGQKELYRNPTSIKEKNDPDRGEKKQIGLVSQMGIPANDPQKFKDPSYHQATSRFHLQQDGELRYPSAMRPNAFWRAANARRRRFLGYKRNQNCLFNALDPPTSERKIIANRYDQGVFAILARYPEIRKNTDQERYRFTAPEETNLDKIKQKGGDQFKSTLCASWRMGSNPSVYGELAKVDFTPRTDDKFKDYCLPGGYDLSGSMLSTEGTPALQADAARVVMAAIWFGSTEGAFSNLNKDGKRTDQLTYYKKRANSKVPRYVGLEENPGGQ